jgi:AcrR family transcriptional regulator
MSSSFTAPGDDSILDDRTTKARIRDAAIECFAENGVSGTTARRVATAAGVSPGLVMHHFGSMEGLRSACDEYVAATIRQYKHDVLSADPDFEVLAALRGAQMGSFAGYLAAALGEDSPAVAKLVDDLVADAEGYLQQGMDTGMVRPSADPRGRAAVVLLWSLGALVLHRHVQRILGVDLTAPNVAADPAFAAYAGPAYEIMSDGIMTDDFAIRMKEAFPSSPDESDHGVRTEPTQEATNVSKTQ